jgi:hypothetical protein
MLKTRFGMGWLSFFIFFSGFSGSAALAADLKNVLQPIDDPKIATHLSRNIFRKSKDKAPTVVVNVERTHAWVKTGDRILELVDNLSKSEGKKFSRVFTQGKTKLVVSYELLSTSVNTEMGCERTEYKVSVEYTDGARKDSFSPESYGEGC